MRLPGLPAPRWLDELMNLALVRAPLETLLLVDNHLLRPPLWELLLAGWVAVLGEETARWLPLLLGSLQVGVVYLIARLRLSTALSVGVAGAVAVCPAMLSVAGDIRPDALLGLTVTLSWGAALAGWIVGSERHRGLHIAATLAALYTHPWAILGVAPQAALWRKPKHWLTVGLLALPSLIWLNNLSVGTGPSLSTPDPTALFWYLHAFAFDEHLSLMLVIGCVVVATRSWSPLVTGLLAWLLGPLALGLVESTLGIPILDQRYTVISLPALWLLAGLGLHALPTPPRRLVVGLLVLMGGLSGAHHRLIAPPPRADWDALAESFRDDLREGDTLIARHPLAWSVLLDRIPEQMPTEALPASPSGTRLLWLMGEHPDQHAARLTELLTTHHLLRHYEAPGGAAAMVVAGGQAADLQLAISDPVRVPMHDRSAVFLYANGRVLLPDLRAWQPGRYAVDVIARGPIVDGAPTLLRIGLGTESETLTASPGGQLLRAVFAVDVPGELVSVRFLNDEEVTSTSGEVVDRNLWIDAVVLSRLDP
ncbi:MAG: hypothetical protein ACI8RZ_001774 [Myxococcota bacterium]